jgi:hypothetical protein
MQQNQWSNAPDPLVYPGPPSYTYRDLSLAGIANGNYLAIQRRQQFLQLRWQVKLLFVALTIACASLLPLRYTQVYHTYQQGTCTITDKQVQEHDTKDKHGHITSRSYTPLLAYDVHIANGEQVSASGFDGPTGVSYSSPTSAQDVVDRYQIGQTTPCWYNPLTPDKAFIIFYGYDFSDALGTFFWCLLAFAGFAGLVYWIFDWAIWRLYALEKRGVVTQGIVLRHEQRRSRNRRYTVSILGFRAAEEAGQERYITVNDVLPLRTAVPVCYDPFFPRYRRYDAWPEYRSYTIGISGLVLLFLTAFIVMSIFWVIP